MNTKPEALESMSALKALSAAAASARLTVSIVHAQSVPVADHHQHLSENEFRTIAGNVPPYLW